MSVIINEELFTGGVGSDDSAALLAAVDGLEGMVDGVETLLTAIDGHVDGIEAALNTIAGQVYTEGDIDASITGPAMLVEDVATSTLRTVQTKLLSTQVAATDYGVITNSVIHGLSSAGGGSYVDVKVNPSGSMETVANQDTHDELNANANLQVNNTDVSAGNPVPVTVTAGIPEMVIVNAISATAFDLNAAPYSVSSSITGDYILDHIQFNFSTAAARTITVTAPDGTVLWSESGNTSLNVVLEDIDKGFNSTENFTIAVTQAGSACLMDVLATIRQGSTTLAGDTYVILQGTQDDGTVVDIPVTSEGHIEVAIHGPRLPFGSIHTESMTPIFQADAVYGVNSSISDATIGHLTGGVTSATVTGTNNLFKCSTGTTALSFSTLQSKERLRYRAGQGVVGRFTALFSTPAANSILVAGFGTGESGYYVGYNGTDFGLLHSTGGVREIQTLTVTTASTSANSYQITLAGTSHTVTATNNGSTVKTAYEISQGTYPGWDATQRGSTVVFLANAVGNKTGTFSVAQSGAGTPAAGSFVETLAGVAATDTWVTQANWNGDKCNGTGASGFTIDPTKGNVFELGVQYLGFGTVTFQVEAPSVDGNNAEFIVMHTFNFPNTRTAVTSTNPSFPFTMAAYSAGSTTDVSVSVGSYAGFVEGPKKLSGPRMTYAATSTTVSTSSYWCLETIRNERVYNGRANQAVVNLVSFGGAHDDATPVTLFLIKNATLAGTPNFVQHSTNSCTYVDNAATTCTITNNEQIVFSMPLGDAGSGLFSFTDEITLQPGETLTVAAQTVTGTATYTIMSLNTREDQ